MDKGYALGGFRAFMERMGGTDKKRLLAAEHFAGLFEGERFLDIGRGSPELPEMLEQTPGRRIYSIDLRGLPAQGQFISARMTDIPFADGFFDGAVTVDTLELWDDIPGGLGEIWRVLREGGAFVCVFSDSDPRELRRTARQAGFSEVRVKVMDPERSWILICRK